MGHERGVGCLVVAWVAALGAIVWAAVALSTAAGALAVDQVRVDRPGVVERRAADRPLVDVRVGDQSVRCRVPRGIWQELRVGDPVILPIGRLFGAPACADLRAVRSPAEGAAGRLLRTQGDS